MTVANDLTPRGQPHGQMALEDRFEVLKEIGDGSFGSVVLARVRTAGANVARRGSVVAIKSMKKTFDSLAPCLELREVVFLRTLPQHPHLVPALDIFLDPYTKKLHIAMEYMEGNLYQLMKARDHKCLDNSSVKSILFQIMQGLEHIHSHHFFHRDIKPENILVSTSSHQESSNSFRRYSALVTPPSTPPTYTVKLADFGLARETHSKLPYTTYVSTRWYRAPEVLLRAGEYSAPVDIWAVGAMAVEIATLKPLFPGGNEVDQVWRVCEIMGSPGNWYNKANVRVGGGDWRDGTRLAGKLGFSFPKMAPHSMDTILQSPQWPPALSNFVTWCLMWDPKNRPTSTQALNHDYFQDAVDPLRPKSSASKILGRKQSDLGRASKDGSSTSGSSKPSWFRKSLIGARNETAAEPPPAQVQVKDALSQRPPVMHSSTTPEMPSGRTRPGANKRSTWSNGLSNVAPMPILPTIRPISPLSDAVTARANNGLPDASANSRGQEKSKKIGRQLSMASTSKYTELHRQQAERALNGHTGLASPPSGQKESFFSHLRKRARRFSGRHQTPVSPSYEDMEAQIGCGPWGSNRSSMVVDQQNPIPKAEVYESLDKALRDVQNNTDARSPIPLSHQQSSGKLKRHHSLPQHQARSVDNLIGAARNGPISSRTRRAQAVHGVQQYEAPAEEDELLDEVLTSTQRAMHRMDGAGKPLRQSASNLGLTTPHPYPSPSPSANGNQIIYGDGQEVLTPKPLDLSKKTDNQYKWPTPPYEGSEWGASASASIWAAGSRF
ncbi:Non-specific serine/threonine protein kinase [Purpureocillium takamizusanense]|uniref:Non-specific serine/threonine protein kinase n=1 Tax=Purpureocillium takamizusanense TaxID=2060973 RepID=A0A9Q8V7J5_9HYPO|nr:Non-specific serine/threonine protein kinase [Purpureocillium takamizusanense]UNI16085.1 Non-specific serine/threonine protein kinase [Purpureocillium takamizusanense]